MNLQIPKKQTRGPQKRGMETKRLLLEAATAAFSTVGFEGINSASLEEDAGVQRGLLAYHYGSKEALWRAVIDHLTTKIEQDLRRLFDAESRTPGTDPLEAIVRAFIRTNAESPQFLHILVQERSSGSTRLDYVGHAHIRRFVSALGSVTGRRIDVHDYYIFVGALTFAFLSPREGRRIWNVDTLSDEFITAHAKAVTSLLRASWEMPENKPG